MINTDCMKRFNYCVLQAGSIVLKPNKRRVRSLEHRCTAVLIWPERETPSVSNTVLTDPCFTGKGFRSAVERLDQIGISFSNIGRIFVTHRHSDHCLSLPADMSKSVFPHFRPGGDDSLSGISAVPCPGHCPALRSLVFRSTLGENVWIAGDAVLDEEWLRAWAFYWPNIYSHDDVVQTWRSVAKIIRNADVIVPGHGKPFNVTLSLVEYLLAHFSDAAYSEECEGVEDILRGRAAMLRDA